MISFNSDHAKKKGFDRIKLNMREFNDTALKFYEWQGLIHI